MYRPVVQVPSLRGCAAAVLGALPVFLLGCVAVLIGYQIRLGYLQAASTGFGSAAEASSLATEVGTSERRRHHYDHYHTSSSSDSSSSSSIVQHASGTAQGGGDGAAPGRDAAAAAAAAASALAGNSLRGGDGHAQHTQQQQQGALAAGQQHAVNADTPQHTQQKQQQQPQEKDTLVVYVFNEDDPAFTDSFHYFLLAGVQQDSRCAYVVIVHERALQSAGELPDVPAVQYVYYGGPCLEWGMVGWMLDSGLVPWRQYRHYILLSSAVRGPFLPMYLQGHMHWTEPLLSRLRGKVKLVGPVISCIDVPSELRNATAPWSHAPHLPFHALATDRVGLDVLIQAGVTACHTDVWREKHASELTASLAMLKAGYSLDCLLIRYQGVDWSNPSAWSCNRGADPAGPGDFPYDGTYLDPMEVVFARVNSPMLKQRVPSAVKAAKFSQWAVDVVAEAAGVQHNHTARVAGNAFHDNRGLFKLPRILTAVVRGSTCFDSEYFASHNQDLFGTDRRARVDTQLAWKFFVYIAQFEDRPFRYTCGFNYSSISVPSF